MTGKKNQLPLYLWPVVKLKNKLELKSGLKCKIKRNDQSESILTDIVWEEADMINLRFCYIRYTLKF